jgi:hypothetical protein
MSRKGGDNSARQRPCNWLMSLQPDFFVLFIGHSQMGRAGIEPATLGLKVPCSAN